jgi:hypothetical protein
MSSSKSNIVAALTFHFIFHAVFSTLSIAQYLAPEVMSFFGSIILFVVIKRAATDPIEPLPADQEADAGSAVESPPLPAIENELTYDKWKVAINAGKVLSLIALCVTGALQPSVPSVVYYLVFLGAATWWGCNKELERCEIIPTMP